MKTTELRDQAKDMIEALPADRLKVASAFLAFLGTAAGEETGPELARIVRMRRRINKAERDIAAGRDVDWREVRSDV